MIIVIMRKLLLKIKLLKKGLTTIPKGSRVEAIATRNSKYFRLYYLFVSIFVLIMLQNKNKRKQILV
jgi:hypothetical protein